MFLFQGKLEVSSVTGRLEPKEAPAWQRLAFRYLVSFPIIGLCLALVFVVMFAMLQLQVIEQTNTRIHTLLNHRTNTHRRKKRTKINFPLFTYQPQFSFSSLSSAFALM